MLWLLFHILSDLRTKSVSKLGCKVSEVVLNYFDFSSFRGDASKLENDFFSKLIHLHLANVTFFLSAEASVALASIFALYICFACIIPRVVTVPGHHRHV